MKKLFKASVILFSIFSLSFFSCQTTGSAGALDLADSEPTVEQESSQEEIAPETPETEEVSEEKIQYEEIPDSDEGEIIPHEEVDELNRLFENAENLDKEESNLSEEKAVQENPEEESVTVFENETDDKNEVKAEETEIKIPLPEKKAESISNKTPEPEKVSAPSQEAKPVQEEKKTESLSDSSLQKAESIPEYNGTVDENGIFSEQKEILPSRTMTVKNNQFVDVVYPGTGWIYLGEQERQNIFVFNGRKLGDKETTFTLRSKKPGKALLHFYKNDFLTKSFIDDFIEITVSDENATGSEHVTAPSYADVVPPKPELAKKISDENEDVIPEVTEPEQVSEKKDTEITDSEKPWKNVSKDSKTESVTEAPQGKIQTVIQTSGDEEENVPETSIASKGSEAANNEIREKQNAETEIASTGNYLEEAWKAYNEKKYAEALKLVQLFFDNTATDFDEGLYLEGQILEAKSEVQNIKGAQEAYRTVIENYPESNWWTKAKQRSIYLKRFYIDIR